MVISTFTVDPIMDGIARECASGVRGCCTDEQYQELIRRIAMALMAERDDACLREAADEIERLQAEVVRLELQDGIRFDD